MSDKDNLLPDDPASPNEISVEVDNVQPPAGNASEGLFVRLSILNTIIAVAGVFTGAVALWAALQESEAVRKQSAAAVWPFVQLSTTDYADEKGAFFALSLTNAGIGPARIEAMYVQLADGVVHDWGEAVTALVPDGTRPVWGQQFSIGRVLRPGETAELITTRDENLARAFAAAVLEPENRIAFCYCSIFDECWLADSQDNIQRPTMVVKCPAYGGDGFRY